MVEAGIDTPIFPEMDGVNVEHQKTDDQTVWPLLEKLSSDSELAGLWPNALKAALFGIGSYALANIITSALDIPKEVQTPIDAAAGLLPPILIHAKWYLRDRRKFLASNMPSEKS